MSPAVFVAIIDTGGRPSAQFADTGHPELRFGLTEAELLHRKARRLRAGQSVEEEDRALEELEQYRIVSR